MELADEELERLFVKSPEKYFRDVYDRYSGPLFRFLYRFTGNNQVSEEILHDIFLEVWNGKFREVGGLKSWLFTVAKNRGLNHVKKSSRVVQKDLSQEVSTQNLEEETIQAGLLLHLHKVEPHLPVDLKETWSLRKSGMDYNQIAVALSIPVGTVKSRFSRLVEVLRKEFDNEY